ncbi:uncharacterized protein HMPREF1541_09617 [Cyphellophora europaea CBS 101466]|uniref:Uncharacterized protein n=1 Tax=Cyphellophora europaea (strain CBS 101466) TaxID=1220924 RepID=W2SCY3_CYPE1|nr:uncharacterized protein HMPREF1541_09617 [Cyphellophora europaea CBS 101466]ETN45784.1 hypothetical protein HMPREF1541_09617 [Cyphellophora europaea CBS 101466]
MTFDEMEGLFREIGIDTSPRAFARLNIIPGLGRPNLPHTPRERPARESHRATVHQHIENFCQAIARGNKVLDQHGGQIKIKDDSEESTAAELILGQLKLETLDGVQHQPPGSSQTLVGNSTIKTDSRLNVQSRPVNGRKGTAGVNRAKHSNETVGISRAASYLHDHGPSSSAVGSTRPKPRVICISPSAVAQLPSVKAHVESIRTSITSTSMVSTATDAANSADQSSTTPATIAAKPITISASSTAFAHLNATMREDLSNHLSHLSFAQRDDHLESLYLAPKAKDETMEDVLHNITITTIRAMHLNESVDMFLKEQGRRNEQMRAWIQELREIRPGKEGGEQVEDYGAEVATAVVRNSRPKAARAEAALGQDENVHEMQGESEIETSGEMPKDY